jgi:hypothetical protein
VANVLTMGALAIANLLSIAVESAVCSRFLHQRIRFCAEDSARYSTTCGS